LKEINIQNRYEEVLSAHWHKLHQIKELVDTDSGSELRARSISDRRKELALIALAERMHWNMCLMIVN